MNAKATETDVVNLNHMKLVFNVFFSFIYNTWMEEALKCAKYVRLEVLLPTLLMLFVLPSFENKNITINV